MANLNGFDASKVEPSSQFEALPAGEYRACIVESKAKSTKDGSGEMIELKLQILDGPAKNRTLFDRLNLKNKSGVAVEIAKATLSSICRAVNVMQPKDSSELHMKPLMIKVAQKEYNGNMQNEIKSYKACLPQAKQPSLVEQSFETTEVAKPAGW